MWETLEESRETMRRFLTCNDENIEIAEMWQSLIINAGDRFLDENSRCFSEISTIYAAGQGISHPSLATEEVANSFTATTP
jgi:hypothetical protein